MLAVSFSNFVSNRQGLFNCGKRMTLTKNAFKNFDCLVFNLNV